MGILKEIINRMKDNTVKDIETIIQKSLETLDRLKLSDLNDIDTNNVTDKQVLTYDAIDKKWKPYDIQGGVDKLSDLSDVNIQNISDGNVLSWNSTNNKWEPISIPLQQHIHNISDVNNLQSELDAKALNDLSNVSDNVILNKIKNVDGPNSGLDADTLDGMNSTDFASVNHSHNVNDLLDININSVSDKDILHFNINTNKWENINTAKSLNFPMFRVWLGYNGSFYTNANSMTKIHLPEILIDTHNSYNVSDDSYYIPTGWSGIWFIQFTARGQANGTTTQFVPQIRKYDPNNVLERLVSGYNSFYGETQYAKGQTAIGIAVLNEGDRIQPWTWTETSIQIYNYKSTKETFFQGWFIKPL